MVMGAMYLLLRPSPCSRFNSFPCLTMMLTLTGQNNLLIPYVCSPSLSLSVQQICWENRFRGGNKLNRCNVTVDGTDFRIADPTPVKKVWYSQKFNGPGLRYEIACSLYNGDIVWINGPYAPRHSPDISIFRYKLKKMLLPGEQVVCDKGYRGDRACCTPYDAKNRLHFKAMSMARVRHETVNRCLKKWRVLKDVFRHHRSKHHIAFRAVAVLTQIAFENGYKPFQLVDFPYEDPIFGYPHPSGGPAFVNNTTVTRKKTKRVQFAAITTVRRYDRSHPAMLIHPVDSIII